MNVVVVAPSPKPFSHGGAERFSTELVRAINEHTPHQAELLKVVVDERTLPPLISAYHSFAELDLSHFDLVVSCKYPAWMVPHHNHVLYLLHPLRGLYDTYPSGLALEVTDPRARALCDLLASPPDRERLPEIFGSFAALVEAHGANDELFAHPGPLGRALVHHLDAVGMRPGSIARHFALSHTVLRRAGCLPPGTASVVLHPPPTHTVSPGGRFEHLFTFSRLDGPKRIDLLIEAMKLTDGPTPLKIAGSGPELSRLKNLAAGDPRIELLGRVSDEELGSLLRDALAVPFVPLDEDYGLVAVEAMAAGKPVITCHDSGGPTELVVDGVSGLVTEPNARAIARAIGLVTTEGSSARRLGAAARDAVAALRWSDVAASVVGGPQDPSRGIAASPRGARGPASGRQRLVIASTFPVHPPFGGGQVRCAALAVSLSASFDVEIVSLGPGESRSCRTEWAPGIAETVVPISAAHQQRDDEWTLEAGVPVTDIVAGQLASLTPQYAVQLRAALSSADVLLLPHPYMYPVVRAIDTGVPVVYDAHNAECDLKEQVLPDSPVRGELLAIVRDVEGAAARAAALIAVCAPADREVLAQEYGVSRSRFVDVPNCADAAGVAFVTGAERRSATQRWLDRIAELGMAGEWSALAVFLGSWHPPNNAAGRALCDQAWFTPEVLHVLAGSHTASLAGVDLAPNVVVAGLLAPMAKRGLLRAATVGLNPVESGSGTNLKMLDYFAAGVPVLSTPAGTRGLEVQHGREVLLSELQSFPAALSDIGRERSNLDALAGSARALVDSRYDWRISGDRLRRAILEALG